VNGSFLAKSRSFYTTQSLFYRQKVGHFIPLKAYFAPLQSAEEGGHLIQKPFEIGPTTDSVTGPVSLQRCCGEPGLARLNANARLPQPGEPSRPRSTTSPQQVPAAAQAQQDAGGRKNAPAAYFA